LIASKRRSTGFQLVAWAPGLEGGFELVHSIHSADQGGLRVVHHPAQLLPVRGRGLRGEVLVLQVSWSWP
jgi:hypothetical protein